jgi:chemotaxis protein CheY-P-specific phosphatase CheC
MVNGKPHLFRDHLRSAFASGYSNAASSFSTLINDKIDFNNFHFDFHKLDSTLFTERNYFRRSGEHLLVTTDVFGDITGKSYLFLNDQEYDVLTAGVPVSKSLKIDFKKEFIKELDNIISASVITRLSNELKLKMYGDVPLLRGRTDSQIEDIIYSDFNSQTEVYINSIFFSSDRYPAVRPFFIWVMDSSNLYHNGVLH